MFNISFVVVTVRARMQGFPRHLEEAAMDLGATPWATFWKVTFPLILPGVLAGALLAFSLSIDDFIITNFTAGTATTFPLWVWASIRNNLPPQVQVIGTMVFVGAVALVALNTLWERRVRASRPTDRRGRGCPRDQARGGDGMTGGTARAASPPAGADPSAAPCPTTPSCPPCGAGSPTWTSTVARGRG